MRTDNNAKRTKRSVGALVYMAVGVLLTLTLLTTWFLSGLYAKYVVSGNRSDSAQVAGAGVVKLELWEHSAVLKDGVYELDQTAEVDKNSYGKVIPGVDIAKDPFIKLELQDPPVDYELYLNVTENNFPTYTTGGKSVKAVTYELREEWEFVKEQNGAFVYRYKGSIAPNFKGTIPILKDDKLEVSEHYTGNTGAFSLVFSAYLQQTEAS